MEEKRRAQRDPRCLPVLCEMDDGRGSTRRLQMTSTAGKTSEHYNPSASFNPQPRDARPESLAGSKVAIPRATPAADSGSVNRRVGHACEPCREQKTKCTGDRPSCQRCQDLALICSYGDRKRERTAKQLRDFANQIQDYEQLLNDLHAKLDQEDVQLIQETLSRYRLDGADELPIPTTRSGTSRSSFQSTPEQTVLTRLLGGIDYTDEDFNRNEQSKATGFVGKHSETSWIFNLSQKINARPFASDSVLAISAEGYQDRHSVASVSYFLDDADIPIDEDVDPAGRPPQAVAEDLMNIYFNTVHHSFPIIGKETFIGQMQSFYTTPFVRPGRRWLAILNMICAIAARCRQQIDIDGVDDDLVFFSRAWKLGMGENAILGHPDLQQVQIEGLTSFYLLIVGHVNRSWRICGMAIRAATAMGLNLRSESTFVTTASKEARYRVWWSLYTLETVLGNMTGRPFSTRDDFCTTPLPIPFEEGDFSDGKVAQIIADKKVRNFIVSQLISNRASDLFETVDDQAGREGLELVQPNTSFYFFLFLDLTRIKREAIETLYAPGKPSWDVESVMMDLNAMADQWLSKLPDPFWFADDRNSDVFDRERISLAFHFYSTRIMICKPCLHHPDRRQGAGEKFYDSTSTLCLEAACRMLDLFPSEYDATWLHQNAPWWSILHYTLQATTVLLIELSFRLSAKSQSLGDLLDRVSKAASWLQGMGVRSLASHRAWIVVTELLSGLEPIHGLDHEDDSSGIRKYRRIGGHAANRASFTRRGPAPTSGSRQSASLPVTPTLYSLPVNVGRHSTPSQNEAALPAASEGVKPSINVNGNFDVESDT